MPELARPGTVLAYELKTLVARHPRLALPIQRLRRRGEVLGPDTEIVIESFPRCASSFAVAAFRLAQEPRASRIAHHTHAPAQVIAAVRRGVPALVLIREPEEAVLSHVIYTPGLSPAASLRGYVRFHEPLLPYREGFVVGLFEEVVSDFGAVIRRVNARFGTDFRPFEHRPEHLARIDREIEEDYRSRARSEAELERTVPLPTEARRRLKERLRAAYRAAPERLRRRAETAYEALREEAARGG
ncbi:MAG: hypothetical protein KatS3mg014_1890 [Actinomycetota bacterium]|nr:MAG: hypothetical protein KatS3mg014_1890 [Actinomycetota bacterium]